MNYDFVRVLEVHITQRLTSADAAIIEGIVLTFNDHPTLWQESAAALVSAMKSSALGGDPEKTWATWCLTHAAIVGTTVQELRATLLKQLPRLAGLYLPISRVDEFQPCYLDMLRSMLDVPDKFPVDVVADVSTKLRHRVNTAAMHAVERQQRDSKAAVKKGDVDGAKLSMLLQDVNSAGAVPGGAKRSQKKSTAKMLADYVVALQDTKSVNFREFCVHCGAKFRDKSARNNHMRMHFFYKEAAVEERKRLYVRRCMPSAEDWINSGVSGDNDGAFVKLYVPQDAIKADEFRVTTSDFVACRATKRQREADGEGETSRPSVAEGKRDVVIDDPATPYRCEVCKHRLVPRMDSRQGRWVLPECVQQMRTVGAAGDTTVAVMIHVACLSA